MFSLEKYCQKIFSRRYGLYIVCPHCHKSWFGTKDDIIFSAEDILHKLLCPYCTRTFEISAKLFKELQNEGI